MNSDHCDKMTTNYNYYKDNKCQQKENKQHRFRFNNEKAHVEVDLWRMFFEI